MLNNAAYRYINGVLEEAFVESDISLNELLAVSDNVQLLIKIWLLLYQAVHV